MYALPLPINMPPFKKVSMYGVIREGLRKRNKTKKKKERKHLRCKIFKRVFACVSTR